METYDGGDTLLHPPLRVFLDEEGGGVSKQDAYPLGVCEG
jgi:hypothetical protein